MHEFYIHIIVITFDLEEVAQMILVIFRESIFLKPMVKVPEIATYLRGMLSIRDVLHKACH